MESLDLVRVYRQDLKVELLGMLPLAFAIVLQAQFQHLPDRNHGGFLWHTTSRVARSPSPRRDGQLGSIVQEGAIVCKSRRAVDASLADVDGSAATTSRHTVLCGLQGQTGNRREG